MVAFIGFFYYVLRTIILVHINYQLLGVHINFKKTILIVVTILAVSWTISSYAEITAVMDNNIYILIVVIIFSILRISSAFQVFVCTVISINTTLMINDIFLNSLITFNNIASSTLYYNPLTYSLVTAVFLFSDLLVLILLKHFHLSLFEGEIIHHSNTINNETKHKKITFNRYNIIIIVIVSQTWLLTMYFFLNDSTMLNISSEVHSIKQDFLTLIISSTIIILNIIVIFMVKNILISEKEQYQYKVKEKEFAHIQQQDKIVRQYKHDFSNHMKVIRILSKEKKYEALDSYLANYDEEISSNIILVNTGLEELDILLNSKIHEAQIKNIIVKYDCITDIKCDKRHIINLISIIGNVLDNAIEASEKSKEKIIELEINKNSMDYIFIIKNTTTNELRTSNILLKEGYSTKGQGRGIGLSVVKRLVKKYCGNIKISTVEGKVVINIYLPKFELE